jgi:hypothetical protein
MKKLEFRNLIREEVSKIMSEELDYTYEGIEDSILQGISDWTELKKEKIWNSLSAAGKRALMTLVQELKPMLDKSK